MNVNAVFGSNSIFPQLKVVGEGLGHAAGFGGEVE